MARCRVFVLPSRTEAMGRVLIEAMAMGKTCIASAVDGIPHYVRDEDTGLLFRSGDAADCRGEVGGPFPGRVRADGG